MIKNTLYVFRYVFLLILLLAGFTTQAQELTFHGRIVDSTTNVGINGSVTFRVEVRTPTTAGDSCLMYREDIVRNVSNGVYVLRLNAGLGTPTFVNGYTVQQVFSNKNPFGSFVLPGTACSLGGPITYTPGATDSRRVSISFNDPNPPNNMAPGTWEPLPTQVASYVPTAIESLNVGGFPSDSLLRVVSGTSAVTGLTPLNVAQYNELISTLTGTSTYYLGKTDPAVGFTGTLGGDVTGTQAATVVTKLRGIPISTTPPGVSQTLIYNGTQWVPFTDGGGTVTNVSSANSYLSVTTPTSTPVLTVNVGVSAGTVAAGNDPRIVGAIQSGAAAGGDLAGTYPNPTVGSVGGRTAAQINTSVGDTLGASSTNTPGSLVRRDGAGNASFTTVQATNFSGRNVYLYNVGNSNFAQIKAPDALGLNYTLTLPTTAPVAGTLLTTNASGDLSWVSPSSIGVTSVTATSPVFSSGGSTPNITIQQGTSTQNGYISSTDWNTFNNKLSTNLPTGQAWIGSASGTASAKYLDITNIRSTNIPVANPWFSVAGACAAGTTLTYSAVTDQVTCAAYSLTSAQVTTALGFTPQTNALPANQIFVGNASGTSTPVTMTGDASIVSNGTLTISNNAITNAKIANNAVDNSKISDVNWIKVTSTPTTIGGYGITDAILLNTGGVDSMEAHAIGARPAANAPGVANRVFVSTDTGETYWSNGVTWIKIGSAVGSGGTVTSVTGTLPITVTNTSSTPVVSISQADGTTNGYLTSADWSTFNAKLGPALPAGQLLVGNAGGVATAVSMTGDATLNSSGSLALSATGVASGTYTKVQVDTKGRVIAGSNLSSADVTSGLGYTPVNRTGDTMTGTLNLPSNGLQIGAGQLAATGGGIVIGAAALTPSAQLEVSSTTLGFLIPRMTTAQRNAIATPARGLQIFNTSTNSLDYYDGSSWLSAASTTGSLSSLNGLTAQNQLFAVGSAGTDFNISSTSATHTFNIPNASLTNERGLLTSSDYTRFNTKVGLIQVDPPMIINNTTPTNPIITLLQSSGVQDGYLTSGDWTVFNNKLNNSLTTDRLWIGVGGVPTALAPSGDITSVAGGVFTLASTGVASGTYAKVTVDAKGRVTAGSGLNSSDVTNGLGYTPVNKAGDTMTGSLNLPSNGLNVGSGQLTVSGSNVSVSGRMVAGASSLTTSAQFEVSSTTLGFLMPRMTTAQRNAIATPATGLQVFNTSTNSIDYYDGATWLTAATTLGAINSLNGLTSTSQTFAVGSAGTDFNISSSGSVHTYNIPNSSAANRGLLTSADWSTFNNKQTNSLALGQIWVGNASGTAAAVTPAGDVASALNGSFVLANSGVASGTYGSAAAVPSFSVDSKGRITLAGSQAYQDATAITKGIVQVGSGLAVSSGTVSVNYGSVSNTAAQGNDPRLSDARTPTGAASGDLTGTYPNPTVAAGAINTSKLANLAVTDAKINDVSWLKVTSTPTTIAGYGITDTVLANAGGMNSVQAGALSARPAAAGVDQRFYVSTDTGEVYLAVSGTWIKVGSAAGSGGTVTQVTGTLPISVANTSSTPVVSISRATTSVDGYLASADFTRFNNKVGTIQVDPPMIIDNSTPTSPIITLLQASNAQNGYLTSTDWTSFNAKVNKSGDTMTGQLVLPSNGLVVGANQLVVSGTRVAIGSTSAAPSSVLDITSTTAGFLLPRMNTTQRDAIISPALGLQIFNTTTNSIDYYDGLSWLSAASTVGAIANLNGLTSVSQTFAVGSAGTDFNIGSAGSVHTFNIPNSSASNQRGLLTSTDWSTFNAKLSNTLATDRMWVGVSGVPTAVLPSGDVASIAGGVFTLAPSGVVSGTYAKVQVDAKGRVVLGTGLNSSDVTTGLGYTPVNRAGDTMTGALNLPSNGLNVGSGQLNVSGSNVLVSGRMVAGASSLTTSAQFEVSSTTLGFLMPRMTTVQRDAIATPATGLQIFNTSTNSIDYYNGTIWLSAASSSGALASLNGLTATSQTFAVGSLGTDFNISSSGTVHTYNIPNASTLNQRGLLTSSDFTRFNNKVTTIQVDPPMIIDNSTPTSPIITLLQGGAGQDGYITSSDWTTFNAKVTNNLPLNQIWVGNAGSSATATAVTGDLTMTGGNFQLATTGVVSGTYAKVQVDAKGRVTSGSGLISSDITSGLGYTPVNKNGDTMTGLLRLPANGLEVGTNQFVVSGSGVVVGASSLTPSSVFEVSSTTLGFLMPRMTTAQRNAIATPATGLQVFNTSTNSIDYYNGTIWQSAASSAGALASLNGLTAVSQTFAVGSAGTDFNIASSGTVHTYNIPNASASNQRGLLTSNDWTLFNNKQSTALASGTVWIGNSSGVAAPVTVAGDASLANNGVLTLANTSVVSGTYAKVQVDAKGRVTAGLSMTSSDITTALAYTPVDRAGDTMTGALNLPSNGLNVGSGQLTVSGTNVSVSGRMVAGASSLTTSAQFEVSSTTLGFLMPRMTTAQRNAIVTPATGLQVFNTSTNSIDYYNGTIWQSAASSSGALASLNGLTATSQTFAVGSLGTDFNISSSGTVHTYNIPNASTLNQRGLLTSSDFTRFNNKVTTIQVDPPMIIDNSTPTSPIITLLQGGAGQDGYITSSDWTTFNAKVTNSLPLNQIWVGNAGSSATATTVSGDLTMTGGNFQLATTGVASGTYAKVQVDAKGRVTSGSGLISSDITSGLGYTPVNKNGDTMTGLLRLPANGLEVGTNQFVVSGSGVVVGASSLTPSSVFEVSSTTLGFLMPRMTTAQRNAIATPATGLQVFNTSTNSIDYYNGTIWQSAASSAGALASLNGLTAVSQTFAVGSAGTDFNIASSGTVHTYNIPNASASNQRGLLTSNDWTLFNNKQSTALASGTMWVGNGSGVAAPVTMTGDATITNSGVLTLANTSVVSGTYAKVQVDAKGRVTAGLNMTSSDITTALAYTPVDRAGDTMTGALNLPSNGLNVGSGQLTVSGSNVSVSGRMVAGASSLTTSAQFEVSSTTLGFLMPRMTTAQRNAILTPATGLQVFNTSTNSIDYYNGTIWQSAASSSGALASLNGLTATSQTFAVGSLGTDFNISSSGTVHTYNIPSASALNQRGLLTSSDFTRFNNKVTTIQVDPPMIIDNSTPTSPIITLLQGGAGQDGYITSSDWTAFNAKVVNNLPLNQIWVGNAGSSATATAVTGDLTMTGGNFQLATTGVASGTYTKVQVDAKGRVTSGSSLNSADITTALTYTPVNRAGDTMTGALNLPSNGLNVGSGQLAVTGTNVFAGNRMAVGASALTTSAQFEVSSTTLGFLMPRMTTAERNAIATPATGLQVFNTSTNTIDYYNGTVWASAASSSGALASLNGLTAVSQTFTVTSLGTDFSVSSAGSVHSFNIPNASASNQRGLLTSSDFTRFNNKVTTIQVDPPMIIDNSTPSSPIITLLQGGAGQDGYITSSDWTAFNAKVTNNLPLNQIWVGSAGSSATATTVTGDATMSAGNFQLTATGVASGTYTKVQVDTKGRVIASSSLNSADITTALTYTPVNRAGDTMTGALNLPSNGFNVGSGQLAVTGTNVFAGNRMAVGASSLTTSAQFEVSSTTLGFLMPRMTTAERNAIATPATGLQVFNTSTNTIDYYNGTVWVSAASSSGALASLNGLTAVSQTFAVTSLGTDFSVSSAGSVHSFNIPNASASNQRGLLTSNDWTLFNNKQSTALASGTMWIGNGSGVAAPVTMAGDASLANNGVLTLANTSVVSGTYAKVQVDAKGRVTAGLSMTSSDITTALAYTPVDRAGDTMTGALNLPSNGLNVGSGQLAVTGTNVFAGNRMAVGASALTTSAQFEVSSTTLGFLMPRMTTAQRNAIVTPATGLQIFNTSTNSIDYYNGTIWQSAASSSGALASLNGLTATSQTFTVTSLGTDFSVSSAGSVHSFNIPNASGSNQRGLLTSSDFTRFNNKVGTIQVDPPMIIDNSTPTSPIITLLQGGAGQDGYITSSDWTAFNAKVVNNLPLNQIWVGNAGSSATATAVTGDLTMTGGNFQLATTGVASGTYTKVQVDTKGRVTSGSNLNSADITTALTYTPVNKAGDTMTGALNLPSNGLNVGSGQLAVTGTNVFAGNRMAVGASALTTSAQFEVSSTTLGFLMPRMTTAQRNAVATPATGLQVFNTSTNTIDYYNGTVWVSAASSSGALASLNGLTATSQTFTVTSLGTDFSVSSAGSVHSFNIPNASASNQRGLLTSNDWTLFNNKQSTALASGTMWIGNGSGVAAPVTMTGDATITNSGVLTLANTSVVSGTYAKVQVDAKGRVTAGLSMTSSDITTALAYTPVDRAGDTMTGALNLPSNGLNVGSGQLAVTGTNVFAGNRMAVGASALTTSAQFEVSSTTLGFLMPRMTTAQRNAVLTPATGLQVFNTSTNTIDYYNGTAWTSALTGSGAIASLNGLTSASQTFTVTSLGTDFSVSSAGSVHSFNIPNASGSNQRGLLTSSDFTRFNNKVGTIQVDPPMIIDNSTPSSPIITLLQGGAGQDGYITSSDWTAFNAKVVNNLPLNQIWVGNAGSSATATAVTGDLTMTGGNFQLTATGVASGTYTKVQVDAKGRVTSGSSLNSADITTALTYTPVNRAGDTMTGALNLPSNGLNVGSGQLAVTGTNVFAGNRMAVGASSLTTSAQFEVSSTTLGFLMPRMTTAQRNAVLTPATGLQVFNTSTNTIDYYNGTVWVSAATGSGGITSLNGLTGATQTFTTTSLGTDFSVSSSGTIHSFNIPNASASNQRGLLTSNDWTLFNNKQSTALASGTMWVGNGSGVAAPVTMTGDATISNSGVLTLGTVTVAKGGTGLTSGTSGGIPYYSSASTMASSGVLASGGVVLGGGAGSAPTTTTGTANQVLRVPAGGGSPTFGAIELSQAAAVSGTLAVANGGTGVATTTRNFIFAGPAAANGAPLFRAAVSNDISNVGFVNGGNSFGGVATIGTADNQPLVFETNNVARAILSTTGAFSVSSDMTVGTPGTNAPANAGALQVNGQGYSKVVIDSTAGTTLSWNANNGNTVRWISPTTGTTALTVTATNMQAGASYMLVVRAASTGSVGITCNGTAAKYVPANGSRVGGLATSKSVYTIMYDGEDCLVTWITGF